MLVPQLGTTGIRALADAGLLGPQVLAAHCVQADTEEIELLATHDVAVAHCPRSNAYLGCGVAPLRELREAGVRVCIATDSPASTPSFDMFDEMRAAIAAARARERRSDALSAADALELATLGGARALGLDSDRGSLTPGKRADLTVLSLAETPWLPWEDPVTASVLGGAPERVVATLVSGRTRYEKGGKTWLELIDAAHGARDRLLPARRQAVVIEDTMFFPRLRRQAKWVFLFLAIVFALGFVGFGVGAGGIGLGNVFEGVADYGVPSVSEAEKRVSENPRDPAAFRELATAHQAETTRRGRSRRWRTSSLSARRTSMRSASSPASTSSQAAEAQQRANDANIRAAYIAPGASVAGSILLDGKPLDPSADLERGQPAAVRRGATWRSARRSRHRPARSRPTRSSPPRSRATRPSSSCSARRRRAQATRRRRSPRTRSS